MEDVYKMKFRHKGSERLYVMTKQYGAYTYLMHGTEKRRVSDEDLQKHYEIVSDDDKELSSVDLFFEIMCEIKGRPKPAPQKKMYTFTLEDE